MPAAIVARELGVRVIDTVCVASYDHNKQGDLQVLKGVSPKVAKLGGGTGKGLLIVDDLVDTGNTGRLVRSMMPDAHFATVYAKPKGTAAGRYVHYRSVAGHLYSLSLGHRAVVSAADPSVTERRDQDEIMGHERTTGLHLSYNARSVHSACRAVRIGRVLAQTSTSVGSGPGADAALSKTS